MRPWTAGWMIAGLIVFGPGLSRAFEDPPGPPAQAKEEAPAKEKPAAKPIEPPSPEQIRGWIKDLSSDRFDTREESTRRLGKAGKGAIDLLLEAAQSESLETTCRAIRAIEGISRSDDVETFEAAELAMEKLADSKHRAASRRAAIALGGLEETRKRHALLRVVELGGIVKRMDPTRPIVPADEEDDLLAIVLNKNWKGGDEGLVYIKRIPGLPTLYYTKQTKLSEEALAALQKAMPNLKIQPRGEAMLGVSCLLMGKGCLVTQVARGSAAAEAGIQIDDMILKYDDEELQDFQQLIDITSRHSVGDKVKMEILRDGKPMTVTLTLKEWK